MELYPGQYVLMVHAFGRRYLRIRKQGTCIAAVMAIVLFLCLSLIFHKCNSLVDDPAADHWPRFTNRTAEDGTWFSQLYPYHFHVYSAFYDNRTTLGRYSALRVIVVMEKLPSGYVLYCKISYPRSALLGVIMDPIGAGVYHGGRSFTEYILTCDLPRHDIPPLSVTLTDNHRKLNISDIPVEIPERGVVLRDLAICVSVSYYEIDANRLIEWLEMQRILGVNKVIMYNNSVFGKANDVLAGYREEGFVDLRQSFDFIDDPEERLIHLHMSPVINDCMYRYMFTFRHFAVIDLDEIIVPRRHNFLPDLLTALLEESEAPPVGSFVFRNAYFFFDLAPSGSSPPGHVLSIYLNHLKRIPPSPPGYSVKSIVNSGACVAMHNHFCLKYTPEVRSSWTQAVEVRSGVALMHHYKWCHLDRYLNSPGACVELMKTSVHDNIMHKYKFRLLKNLRTQHKALAELRL